MAQAAMDTDILDRLEAAYRDLDSRLPRLEGNACGDCNICCKAKMRHGVRPVELALIDRFLRAKGSRHTGETFRKFCKARHRIKDDAILYCPFYDRAAKSCAIYPVRPFSCRIYGRFTMRRETMSESCVFRKNAVQFSESQKFTAVPGTRETMLLDAEYRCLGATEDRKKAISYGVGVALYKGGLKSEAERYLRESMGVDAFKGASNLYLGMLYLTEHFSAAAAGGLADLDMMDSLSEGLSAGEGGQEVSLEQISEADEAKPEARDMLELAETAIKDAIAVEPDTPLARFMLANVYLARGEHAKALEELQEALRLDPRLALARHSLGEVYHALGLPEKAVKEYEEAAWIDRTFALPHLGLGIIHYERGELKKAADAFSRAAQLAPKSPVPLFNLGNVYYAAGDLARAAAEFRRALEREEATHILNNLGTTLMDAGILDEARTYLERAAAREPDSLPVGLNLQRLYLERREYDRSVAAFERNVKLGGPAGQAYFLLGRLRFEQGKLAEATEALRKAIALEPDMSDAYSSLGFVKLQQTALGEAEVLLRTALEKNPHNAMAHNNSGLLNVTRGRLEDALACFRKAVELAPGNAQFHFNLALAHLQTGKPPAAAESLRNALKCDGAFVPAHLMLGNVYAEEGKVNDALKQFRRVLELDPSNPGAKNAVAFLSKKK